MPFSAVMAFGASPPGTLDWRFWMGFLGFFILLGGGAWLLHRLSRRSLFSPSSARLRILEHLAVSRDAYVMLLQAGGQVFLLGITKAGISLLSELPAEEFLTASSDTHTNSPLFARLGSLLTRRPSAEPPQTGVQNTPDSFETLLRRASRPETENHPVPEPPAPGESGFGHAEDSRYSDALRQLDALGRWRTEPATAHPPEEMDAVLDRVAKRNQRYGKRGNNP